MAVGRRCIAVAKKWIKGAIKHPGAFKEAAEKAGKTTREFADEKEDAPGKLGKEARLAKTLMGMHHEKSRAEKMYGAKKVKRG